MLEETFHGTRQGASSGGQYCDWEDGPEWEGTVVLSRVDLEPCRLEFSGGITASHN